MAASGARAVVSFAIQLLLLTFAIIGGCLLVRPAAAATASGGTPVSSKVLKLSFRMLAVLSIDILSVINVFQKKSHPCAVRGGGSVTTPPSPVVSGPPHGAEVIGRGH